MARRTSSLNLTRPRPVRTACAVVLLAVVSACGGGSEEPSATAKSGEREASDTSGKDRSTTSTTAAGSPVLDEIIEDLLADEAAADEDEARCVAERLVDELGEDEAQVLNRTSDDLYALPADQIELVRASFNDCVSGRVIGSAFAEEFYSTLGSERPAPGVLTCIGTAFDGKVGDLMLEFNDPALTDDPPSAMQALEDCVPTSVIADLLASSFEDIGLDARQARCVGDRLSERITLGQLADIGRAGGDPPTDIQGVIDDEVRACLING